MSRLKLPRLIMLAALCAPGPGLSLAAQSPSGVQAGSGVSSQTPPGKQTSAGGEKTPAPDSGQAVPAADEAPSSQKSDETAPGDASSSQKSEQTAPGETPPGETPPGETAPGETPPGETPPGEAPPGETPPGETPPGQATGTEQPLPASDFIPAGQGVDKGLGLKLKGYFRSEFKYNTLNLYQGFDDVLGRWTPRGSPYLAFSMLPAADHDSYIELNFEASWSKYEHISLYTDTSLLYSTTAQGQSSFEQLQDALIASGQYTDLDTSVSNGVPIPGAAGGQFVRKAQERLLINELYATTDVPDWLSITLGKRRIFWGSAFTWSPMDVINPPRNPLEPTLLREGSYNLDIDLVHFDKFAASLLFKPSVTQSERGVPTAIDLTTNLLVGRLFVNVLDADLNLVLYNNHGSVYDGVGSTSLGRSYAGLSFSRYFFDEIEVHTETLVERGRPTWLVHDKSYPGDPYAEIQPPYEVGQFDLGDKKLYCDCLLGARYNFPDNSFLLLEYLHHGAGMSRDEYDRYRGFTAYMEEQAPHLLTTLSSQGTSVPEQVVDNWTSLLGNAPFLYQEANIRKNYMGLTFLKSRMWDVLEPKLSVIWNMDDFSGTLYPSAEFTLSRNSGGPGTVKMLAGVFIFLGGRESQINVSPNKFTASLRMTAYF